MIVAATGRRCCPEAGYWKAMRREKMSGTVVDLRDAVVRGRRGRFCVAGDGPPVVLVHGLAGSTRWWSRNLANLAAHHRVYLVDLPGFGTLRRHRERFILAEAASWL